MALTTGFQLPFGIQPLNPVPIDSWSGPYTGADTNAAIAAANAAIPVGVRFKSLEVRLIVDGAAIKYWYKNGILDTDLIEFTAATALPGVATFTTSVSAPALSGTFYGDGSNLTGIVGGTGAVSTASLTADIAAGSIAIGDVIGAGTNFQTFLEKLLFKVYNPTFNAPTAGLASSLASVVESGTTGITLTVNLNRGSIVGKTVAGIWQPSTFQDFRSGSATNYVINGTNNNTTNTLTFPLSVIGDGINTFTSTTTYGQGPQPVDSKQNNYLTPLASGTINANVNVTGARRAFYGVDNAGNTSDLIRTLGSSTSPNVAKGATFSIAIPAGTTSVVFAYPASLNSVASVKYVEGLNLEVKSNFVQTVVSVEGLNNYTGINYNVYRYAPTGFGGVPQPFSTAVTYSVTI